MPRTTRNTIATLVSLATLSAAPAVLFAQNTDSATPANTLTQQQAAPIERSAPQSALTPATLHGSMVDADQAPPAQSPAAMPDQTYNRTDANARRPQVKTMQPAQGIWVRSAQNASVQTVASDGDKTELRVDSGVANVDVRHPAHKQILVDMPGGQVALLKDGLYTFNADTKTASVFQGEAEAFTGDDSKPVKVKEDHQVNFALENSGLKSTDLDPHNAGADLLPANYAPGYGDGNYASYYGAGFYPGPYYAGLYGWPYYGWGPYGWGYPGFVGIGFGYGGYYRGIYRGGYYGGFRGGYAGGFRGGFAGGGGGGFHGGGGRR